MSTKPNGSKITRRSFMATAPALAGLPAAAELARDEKVDPRLDLVYGLDEKSLEDGEETLVYIPRRTAEYYAGVHRLLAVRPTWREYRELEPEHFDTIFENHFEDDLEARGVEDMGYEEWWPGGVSPHDRVGHSELCDIALKVVHDTDCVYPDFSDPRGYLPEPVISRYARRVSGWVSAFFYFDPAREGQINDALQALGYRTERDQRLVTDAIGCFMS